MSSPSSSNWNGREDWTLLTFLVILIILVWLSVSSARGGVSARIVLFRIVKVERGAVTMQPIIPETTRWLNPSEAPLMEKALLRCHVGNDTELPGNPAIVECNGVELRLQDIYFTTQQ